MRVRFKLEYFNNGEWIRCPQEYLSPQGAEEVALSFVNQKIRIIRVTFAESVEKEIDT